MPAKKTKKPSKSKKSKPKSRPKVKIKKLRGQKAKIIRGLKQAVKFAKGEPVEARVFEYIPPEVATPIRAQLLNDARDLTTGPRQEMYGEPSDNIGRIASLRAAFWKGEDYEEITSAWGTAMDAVLTKIGRISSAPTEEMKLSREHYIDAINYLAIALEVAQRST